MSDQHIHDQGKGYQVEVKDGKAYIGDITINEPLPPPSPTGIPSNLPQHPSLTFRGREDDWDKLHNALQQTEGVAITALQGMGGVGKTELALQYATAKLREGAYPGGVCWLRAREQEIGTQITQYFQAQLGLSLPEGLDLTTQVGYCWGHWREGEVLVVVDDVAYQQVAEYDQAIKPYLPTDPRFRVVVTTRQDLGASFRTVRLGVLAEGAALEVLRDLAGASRIDSQIAEANQLCKWLGYLPLGLELVGRYLANKPDLSLAETLRRLESQRLAARALNRPEEVMTATHESIAAAFELSWNDLTAAQRQLGERLSLFALAPIPWRLVEAMQPEADAEDLENDRDTLVKRNLLNRAGDGSYQLHSLIREFFAAKREQATDANDLTRAHCAVLVQVAQRIPLTAPQAEYLALAPVVPHLVDMVNHQMAAVSDEAVLSLANGLVKFYTGQGLYAEDMHWAERCKKQVEARLGPDHPATAASLNNLAGLYYSMGRYSEAEPLLDEKSLEITEAKLGADHPATAASLNNLAGLYHSMGRYSDAEPLYRRSLAIREAQLGADHPDTAASLNNLAELYYSMGRYSEAEPLYEKSLAIIEAQLGADHPATATSLNNLAELYHSMGRYSEAEPLYRRSLEIAEAQLGADHRNTATSLNNLAGLYHSMGRYSDAEPLYRRSLEITEAKLGADHPDTATSLNNLAGLHRSMGRYSEAEPLYRRSLEITEAKLGADHPDTATSLNNLAGLHRSMGRYSEAEPLYRRSLEITEAKLGADHPATAASLNNLAGLHRSMGRYSEAEPLYRRSLEITEAKLGADHPATAASLNNLAGLHRSMGRYSEAEPLYRRSLEITEAKLGADHPATATSLNNLAELYRSVGRYSEAEPLYRRSLEITEAKLGADHPATATSLNNLAELYRSMGRYSEAEPLYGRSLEITEAQLGADHPDTAASLNNLAELYRSMGRYSEAEPLYGRSLAIREAQLGADHPDTAASLNNLAGLHRSMGRYSEAEPLYLRALPILFSQLGQDHPNYQTVRKNFEGLVAAAVQAGRAGELSDHPRTQALLAQLQAEHNPG
jgi:tetratricopeptide (TPR) repeat protein